jgi:hypothetical protein
MKILTSDLWTSRYKAVLKQGVIEQRATVRGVALNDLGAMETEVACLAMQDGFKSVFMPTERICEIIRREVERALAHASKVYADPKAALRAIYSDFQQVEPYMPTLISGPAGSGKTQLRLAIGRVLNGCSELWIDESHPRVPLLDYAHCVIGNQRSITGVLRSLARPEIAQGKARLTLMIPGGSEHPGSWKTLVSARGGAGRGRSNL